MLSSQGFAIRLVEQAPRLVGMNRAGLDALFERQLVVLESRRPGTSTFNLTARAHSVLGAVTRTSSFTHQAGYPTH